jgi:hypothetical protein
LRQPFQTAALRYATLCREWQFVEQHDQFQMSPTDIFDFRTQAKELRRILNQLAAAPNATELVTAESSLTRFQILFRVWMHQETQENPYQVQVWENHLVAIERLLHYGEGQVDFPTQESKY